MQAHRRKLLAVAAGGVSAALVMISGCGPVEVIAHTNIPPPLVVKIPIGVALFIPVEFSSYVHKEERWSTKYQIQLGKAQTDGITGLMNAIFERVVTVESVSAGTLVPGGVAAILEPSIEEYAFVTPRDAGGSPFYAVSIKYRVNVYLPDGKLADSWGFTGYGTAPSQGIASEVPLTNATALAMRDAGAKLAVEFREQAVLRGLLPESPTADFPGAGATPSAPGETSAVAAPTVTTAPTEGGGKTESSGESAAAPATSESSTENAEASKEENKEENKDEAKSETPAGEPGNKDAPEKPEKQIPKKQEPEALAQAQPVS